MISKKHLGIDPEDIEEILIKIEKSYDISFAANELFHVRTFGQLCDHIIAKIKKQDADDCTTQQAFYKLRDVIVFSKQIDKSSIRTDTTLSSIFPRHQRRKQIAEIENKLGFRLKVLRPKHYINLTLVSLFIISLIGLFFNWKFGFTGIISSILLSYLVNMTAKEFEEKTVGQLAEKMTQENYLKSRRVSSRVNRKEILNNIEKIFIRDLKLGNDFKGIAPETLIVERK
jgi:hypothetical protein